MTDVAIGEALPELAPPVPPGPEPEAAAVEGLAPVADQGAVAPTEFALAVDAAPASADAPAGDTGEVETEVVGAFDPRIAIPESLGPVRRAILEGLIDGEGALSVSELHALMPVGTPRGTTEAGILREYRSGRILRISPGHYALAPARPPEAKRPSPPPPPTPEDEATWFAALDGWINDPETWDRTTLGPRPDEPGRRIPPDIVAKGVDRSRKRKERRREAEAAAAKRTAADAELRDRLIAATGGNIVRTSALDDVGPIKLALQVVPIDRILSAIRYQTDRKLYPKNEPARSWGEPRLLKAIAESIVPSLVAAWTAAGTRPSPAAPSSPAAAQVPDDVDELRSHHDVEDEPAGAAHSTRRRGCVGERC
jgi:hypothetical protein